MVVGLANKFASSGGFLGLFGGGKKPGSSAPGGIVTIGAPPPGVPFWTAQQATVTYGGKGSGFTTGATALTPTGFQLTPKTPELAAQQFFSAGPGQPIQSLAPGAAELWGDIAAGYLPTIGAPGPKSTAGDGGQAPLGFTVPGLGATLPPGVLLAIGGAALLLVLVSMRK